MKVIEIPTESSTTGLKGPNLAIKKNVLNSNKGHYFQLKVWSQRQSSPGYANLYMSPNQPPKGGDCTLTIDDSSGMVTQTQEVKALTNVVRIDCSGWFDPDDFSALTYHMFVQRAGLWGLITGEWYPLYRGTQSSGSFYLSQWEPDKDIYVTVEVIDAQGGVAQGFTKYVLQ